MARQRTAVKKVQPVLKWAGGKQGIARRLVEMFPRNFERYYEPFVGGASVLFSLAPERAVAGDANEWLIDAYRALGDRPDEVAELLDSMRNTKEEYLRIRSVLPTTLSLPERAAHLIYLNKTCFRGLFRVNQKGQFNVPYGQYSRRYYDPDNLRAAGEVFREIELQSGDFELCLRDITEKDFVYMDPPYFKLGGYSDFNRYTKDQFKAGDHFRLAAFCRELDERGVRWAVSNSDTPLVRELFDGYAMTPVENRREINLNSGNREITELLVTNYIPESTRQEKTLF